LTDDEERSTLFCLMGKGEGKTKVQA
jgi:hypothetical protein